MILSILVTFCVLIATLKFTTFFNPQLTKLSLKLTGLIDRFQPKVSLPAVQIFTLMKIDTEFHQDTHA
jgi:hypothetical protein